MKVWYLLFFFIFSSTPLFSSDDFQGQEPDWSENASLALGENRANIYQLPQQQWQEYIHQGQLHSLVYPVDVTGLLIPYQPLVSILEADETHPMREWLKKVMGKTVGVKSEMDLYDWLGLNRYPDRSERGIYQIPYPTRNKPDFSMGVSKIETKQGTGLTFSCTTCHTATFFNKKIMGLTNRRVKANRFFVLAKQMLPLVHSGIFQKVTGATDGEREMLKRSKVNLRSVGAVKPRVLGLDTSLPQVALSLSRRGKDEYATKSKYYEAFPSHNALQRQVADSKPLVWWNLKYKTRWLADGSIVAGNPIFTNFLWNEIGRGTDLKELEQWLKANQKTVRELTAAAFATKAPVWGDIFPLERIDLAKAKKGEALFNESCKKCHGEYLKNWSLPNAENLAKAQQIKTYQVNYHEKTPVKNVGTDPMRWKGTEHFAQALNDLKISQWMNTVVEPQEGYVPPPLVGVFTRYPYFHNNSIPNLCELLTPPQMRTKIFYQGPANNPETDFNYDCVGYPTGTQIPVSWRKDKKARFDVTRKGLSNSGHYKMLLTKDGKEKYTQEQKKQLIEFLKTL